MGWQQAYVQEGERMFGVAIFEITNECNLNCKYCYENDRKKFRTLISSADFSCFLAHHEGLCREVILSGGEPFLHPSWTEFVAILRKAGMKVNFITNGTGIDKIIEAHIKVDTLLISVDSFSQTKNLLRSKRIIYTKEDILRLKKSGLVKDIYLQIILNRLSACKENVEDLMEFCGNNQIGLKVKLMDSYGFNDTAQYMLKPSEVSQVEEYLCRQIKIRKMDMDISIPSIYGNEFTDCFLIRKYGNLRIRSDGKIFPCEKMNDEKYQIGVLNDSSDQILANFKKVQNRLFVRIIKLARGTCVGCIHNAICGKGCPVLHEMEEYGNICKKRGSIWKV